MTVVSQSQAHVTTFATKLATSADVEIVAAADGSTLRLESLVASCDGTGSAFSLWLANGATSVFIVNSKTIAANDYLHIKDHPITLKPGWSLKCKDGTGGHIDVTACIAQAQAGSK